MLCLVKKSFGPFIIIFSFYCFISKVQSAYMQLFRRRCFSGFTKSTKIADAADIESCKTRLLNSRWSLKDDIISSYPSKQLYITLESLLNKNSPKYMEGFNHQSSCKSVAINDKFKKGEILPPGYSLSYCNPLSSEVELSIDGYDNYHAPALNGEEYFARRMWVSGSFNFNKKNPLKFGDELSFEETVERVKFLNRSGIISADYKRKFSNQSGLSLTEVRRLCYLKSDFINKKPTDKTITNDIPDETITVTPSIITSFRMSALTFNAHLIHYNPDYAKKVEKYPDVVIEAPLLIMLAFQFLSNKLPQMSISCFKYKITSPSFVNESLTIGFKQYNDLIKLWIYSTNTKLICFEATIQS